MGYIKTFYVDDAVVVPYYRKKTNQVGIRVLELKTGIMMLWMMMVMT